MIYTPEHCKLIPLGLKTQTRRVAKDNEELIDNTVYIMTHTGHHWEYRIKWQVGRTYAIQDGRGHKGNGRTLLLALRREPLQDISANDVEAEGLDVVGLLPSPLHPAALKIDSNAILFLARHAYSRVWDSINKRKGTRWNDAPDIWAHTFEFVEGSDD